jgi:hypothetical protein
MQRQDSTDASGYLRSSQGFVASGLAIVVLIVAITALAIWNARDHAFSEYQASATDLAAVLSEQTERYVQVVDLAMRAAESEIIKLGEQPYSQFRTSVRSDGLHRLLAERMANIPQAGGIAIVGADGEVLNASRSGLIPGLSLSDRDFFQYLKDHDEPSIFVGAPNVSRMTGKWSLYFARRINSQDGSFLALVVGVVDTTYLQTFYQSIGIDHGGSVTVLRRDGTILVRYPNPGNVDGRQIPASSYWYTVLGQGGGHYRSPGYLSGVPE